MAKRKKVVKRKAVTKKKAVRRKPVRASSSGNLTAARKEFCRLCPANLLSWCSAPDRDESRLDCAEVVLSLPDRLPQAIRALYHSLIRPACEALDDWACGKEDCAKCDQADECYEYFVCTAVKQVTRARRLTRAEAKFWKAAKPLLVWWRGPKRKGVR